MDALRLLARAQEWTGAIVAGVRDEDLQRPTPCTDWDVATLLDHLIADLDTFNHVASDEGVDLVASIDPTAPATRPRRWVRAPREGVAGDLGPPGCARADLQDLAK